MVRKYSTPQWIVLNFLVSLSLSLQLSCGSRMDYEMTRNLDKAPFVFTIPNDIQLPPFLRDDHGCYVVVRWPHRGCPHGRPHGCPEINVPLGYPAVIIGESGADGDGRPKEGICGIGRGLVRT